MKNTKCNYYVPTYIHFPIYVGFSKQKRAFVYFSILKEADATLKEALLK